MNYAVAVEEYRPQHLAGLFDLFGTYFHEGDRLLSREYSSWLYGDNPFGKARMVSVSSEGTWVAFVALIPIALERKKDRLPAYYAVNALVDPRHQGNNLFGRMISAAREHISGEGCALVGHPNSLAIKTWNRSRVQFQEVLRPSIAKPSLPPRGWKARAVQGEHDLQGLDKVLTSQAAARDHWKVAVSGAYLTWRYLDQPGNRYKVQVLERAGTAVGVQVVRTMRTGIHLLMDQFLSDEDLAAGCRLLPWITVCFRPDSGMTDVRGATLRLPLRKEVPYFFSVEPGVSAREVRHFNLTASDF